LTLSLVARLLRYQ